VCVFVSVCVRVCVCARVCVYVCVCMCVCVSVGCWVCVFETNFLCTADCVLCVLLHSVLFYRVCQCLLLIVCG